MNDKELSLDDLKKVSGGAYDYPGDWKLTNLLTLMSVFDYYNRKVYYVNKDLGHVEGILQRIFHADHEECYKASSFWAVIAPTQIIGNGINIKDGFAEVPLNTSGKIYGAD